MSNEIEDGGLVPVAEHIARLQSVQKEILAVFHEFCLEHDITYFLVAGSALGAVRHRDVIPWDDDIDVGMLREDYDRFLNVAADRLNDRIFVQNSDTDAFYPFFYAKLRLDCTLFREDAVWELEMHKGIFIDVFPFDNIRMGGGIPKWQFSVMSGLSLLITSVTRPLCEQSRSSIMRKVRLAIYAVRHVIPRKIVRRSYDFLARSSNASQTDLVCCFDMYSLRNYRKTIFPRKDLVPPKTVDFGGMEAMVPREADAYLTALFGDYMTPPPAHMQVPAHAQEIDLGIYADHPERLRTSRNRPG